MKDKEINKRQRELLMEFDKELFNSSGQMSHITAGIFVAVLLLIVTMPVQIFYDEPLSIFLSGFMLSGWAAHFVIFPYINVADAPTPKERRNKIYDALKYIPISRRQYKIVRMTYLMRYFAKLTVAGLVIQIFMAALSKNLGLENIMYIVVMLFIFPLTVGGLELIN